MPRREQRNVGALEFVVVRKWEPDALRAILLAALTDELPRRRVGWVNVGREVTDLAVHLSQQFTHATILKSRLR